MPAARGAWRQGEFHTPLGLRAQAWLLIQLALPRLWRCIWLVRVCVRANQRWPWPEHEGPALAGVSAFGISGTNAHVVLEESPQPDVTRESAAITSHTPCLLTLSGRQTESLKALAQDYRLFLSGEQTPFLDDLCYTASARRAHHDHRLAVIGGTREELLSGLDAFLNEDVRPCAAFGAQERGIRPKVVFTFPSQGSQHPGMGRQPLH